MPGSEATYQSYGRSWAHLSNTPFREYKHWVHEGGIATPLVARWPAGLPGRHPAPDAAPARRRAPDAARGSGATYPTSRGDVVVPPAEGRSMLPGIRGEDVEARDLFWEHEGNSAVRSGEWKLVRRHGHAWELYAIGTDRAEAHDLAGRHPDVVADLAGRYDAWAARCGVVPREVVLDLYEQRGHGLPPE